MITPIARFYYKGYNEIKLKLELGKSHGSKKNVQIYNMLLDKDCTLVLKPDRKYNAPFQRSGLQKILHQTTQNMVFIANSLANNSFFTVWLNRK